MPTVPTAPELPPLRLRLFGPFDARLGGRPLPRLRTRKEQWLLALLTLRGPHALDRLWLAGTLWPDSTESGALGNLRRSLHNLRAALGEDGPRIVSPTPGSVALEMGGGGSDVAAFDDALWQGGDEALERAVALYRGPLLEGCLEEWAVPERAAREQAYLRAREALAARATARQDFPAAARHWRAALGVDPYRESALRGLMDALASGGDRAEALEAYRDFKRRLREETGGEPSPETSALFGRLRPSAPLPDPSGPPRRLPHPLTSLIGRERARRAVASALDAARLVTLIGIGGIGKTRLAIAVGGDCAGEDRDGVWFADLAPLSDAALVPGAVAAALSVLGPGDPRETLRAFLEHKSLLLILDNCEHLRPACAELAQSLLSAAPGLRLLATSRQPLGLPGETVWPVPPLSVEGVDDAPSDAVRLFIERTRQSGNPQGLDGVQATLAGICRRLDGIPLAIELAAMRARSLPVEEIARRLEDRFLLLADVRRPGLPRHQTLRAALDWSHDLLTGEEKTLLRRLSVFAGGWTLDAADAVCADTACGRLPDVLASLVDHSLVVYEDRDQAGRYRLLETVGEYARDRLAETGEAAPVRLRHRHYFLALAETAWRERQGPEQGRWLDVLEADHDNLRAALRGCQDDADGAEDGLRLVAASQFFWRKRAHLREGLALSRSALSRPDVQASTPPRAAALYGAAVLADILGDVEASQTLAEESLFHSRALCDRPGIATALTSLGHTACQQEDFVRARALHAEGLTIRRVLGDVAEIANSLVNMGYAAHCEADFAAARRFYGEALVFQRSLSNRWEVAGTLFQLAQTTHEEGDYAAAQVFAVESLILFRQLSEKYVGGLVLRELALIAQTRRQPARAARGLGAVEALFETLDVPPAPEHEATDAQARAALRAEMGEAAFARARQAGRALSWEQAIAEALAEECAADGGSAEAGCVAEGGGDPGDAGTGTADGGS